MQDTRKVVIGRVDTNQLRSNSTFQIYELQGSSIALTVCVQGASCHGSESPREKQHTYQNQNSLACHAPLPHCLKRPASFQNRNATPPLTPQSVLLGGFHATLDRRSTKLRLWVSIQQRVSPFGSESRGLGVQSWCLRASTWK